MNALERYEEYLQYARPPLHFAQGCGAGRTNASAPTQTLAVGHCWLVGGFEGSVTLVDFVPVHYVPPGG